MLAQIREHRKIWDFTSSAAARPASVVRLTRLRAVMTFCFWNRAISAKERRAVRRNWCTAEFVIWRREIFARPRSPQRARDFV